MVQFFYFKSLTYHFSSWYCWPPCPCNESDPYTSFKKGLKLALYISLISFNNYQDLISFSPKVLSSTFPNIFNNWGLAVKRNIYETVNIMFTSGHHIGISCHCEVVTLWHSVQVWGFIYFLLSYHQESIWHVFLCLFTYFKSNFKFLILILILIFNFNV